MTATGTETMPRRRRLLPPAWLLIHLLAMLALHAVAPWGRWIGPPWSLLGIVPLGAGLAVMIVAARAFDRHRTPIPPFMPSSALVMDGPFRFSRNPMYLGMIMMLTGVATLLGTVTPLLVIPAFFRLIKKRFVEPEELALEQRFGSLYSTYSARVRRWI